MKAIHWVATIAVSLVISAVWVGFTLANYGGNVHLSNAASNTAFLSPAADPQNPPVPRATASHVDNGSSTDPRTSVGDIHTKTQGQFQYAWADAYDGKRFALECNLDPADVSWGWVPDFEWEYEGEIWVTHYAGQGQPPTSYTLHANVAVDFLDLTGDMASWNGSHEDDWTIHNEEQGPVELQASRWKLTPTYMGHPVDVNFEVVAGGIVAASINRSDTRLHGWTRNGSNCGGTIVLYNYDDNVALATWAVN